MSVGHYGYRSIIIILLGRRLQISKVKYQLLVNHCNRRVPRMTSNNLLVDITVHGKILAREKLVNLANRDLFAKIFLHRYTEMYLAYALTVAYSPNFSSPIAFTCMVCQNFSPPNISCVQYQLLSFTCPSGRLKKSLSQQQRIQERIKQEAGFRMSSLQV